MRKIPIILNRNHQEKIGEIMLSPILEEMLLEEAFTLSVSIVNVAHAKPKIVELTLVPVPKLS